MTAEAPLACPACRAPALAAAAGGALGCTACGTVYPAENGFPVLLGPGEARFADATDRCTLEAEEVANRFTATNYYLPLLARSFPGRRDLRLLSAGCGIGADVDAFRAAGIEAWGVDCGGRTAEWPRRRHRAALHLGSVLNLPYRDASFDAVVTGCLLPHIGVEGDTTRLAPGHAEARARAAAELLRVLRPGGLVVTGCPNRRCPADLFHKGQMRGGLVRWHAQDEPFLLSLADFRALFAGARVTALPPAGYWGFHGKRRDPRMRFPVAVLRAWFALLSLPGMAGLRASPLNPWLIVAVRKPT
jgi:SAM-dependent methyltransferase